MGSHQAPVIPLPLCPSVLGFQKCVGPCCCCMHSGDLNSGLFCIWQALLTAEPFHPPPPPLCHFIFDIVTRCRHLQRLESHTTVFWVLFYLFFLNSESLSLACIHSHARCALDLNTQWEMDELCTFKLIFVFSVCYDLG